MRDRTLAARMQRQAGVVAVEFALSVMVQVALLGIVLQTGRTLLMYHAVLTATHSAVFYLATAPNSELIAGSQAKAKAKALAVRVAEGSATDTHYDPVLLNYSCAPNNTKAPCTGTGMPTSLSVTLSQDLNDGLFPGFTFNAPGINIVNMQVKSFVTLPRVGFM